MQRRAAIDLGTNSIRLLIADITATGDVQVVAEKSLTTRIGEKVNQTGLIQRDAMERTLAFIRDAKALIDDNKVESYTFVATSALRDARNAPEFLKHVKDAGLDMRIISGDEEARWIARAAKWFVAGYSPNALMVDQGGGSVELIYEDGDTNLVQSLDIGVVRLTEAMLHTSPPTQTALEAFVRFNDRTLREHLSGITPDQLILFGGTGTALASSFHRQTTYQSRVVHGTRLEGTFIKEVQERMRFMSVEQIVETWSVPVKRADVFLAGVTQLMTLMDILNMGQVTVSDRGLKYALLFDGE